MKNKYLTIIMMFCLILPFTVIAETEQLTVNSYYGKYDALQKKSGFPSPSLEGPIKERWISPIPKKPYRIGILFPTLKDSYWTAANYGVVTYAQKMGLEIIIHSAGAYKNFGNQRNQLFDLAEKSKVDGIILSTVDYKKMDMFVEKVNNIGVPVIGLINDINSPKINAKAMVSYFDAGYKAGEYVINDSLSKNIKIAFFPGPKKSGWAEDMYEGFMAAISELKKENQLVNVLKPQYGDTRSKVQRIRISFLLDRKENHDTDYIVGNAVAAVEAVSYLKKNKKLYQNTKIVSTYITSDIYDYIQKGNIKAAPYDQELIICQIAIDMMVRLLNGEKPGKDFPFRASPEYIMITQENIKQYSYEKLFGSRDFKPVYNETP